MAKLCCFWNLQKLKDFLTKVDFLILYFLGLFESSVHFGDFDVQIVLIQKANHSKSYSKHWKSPKFWIIIVNMVKLKSKLAPSSIPTVESRFFPMSR